MPTTTHHASPPTWNTPESRLSRPVNGQTGTDLYGDEWHQDDLQASIQTSFAEMRRAETRMRNSPPGSDEQKHWRAVAGHFDQRIVTDQRRHREAFGTNFRPVDRSSQWQEPPAQHIPGPGMDTDRVVAAWVQGGTESGRAEAARQALAAELGTAGSRNEAVGMLTDVGLTDRSTLAALADELGLDIAGAETPRAAREAIVDQVCGQDRWTPPAASGSAPVAVSAAVSSGGVPDGATCTACGKPIRTGEMIDGLPYGPTCARTTARGVIAGACHLDPGSADIVYDYADRTYVPPDGIARVSTNPTGDVVFHRGDGATVTLSHDDAVRMVAACRPTAAVDVLNSLGHRGGDPDQVLALVDQMERAPRERTPLPARLPGKRMAYATDDVIIITDPDGTETEAITDDLLWNLSVNAPLVAADIFDATKDRCTADDLGNAAESFHTGRGDDGDRIADALWAKAGINPDD